ncbi:MAG: hypothetical protein EWM72_00450 [Nitrospira sp.]|nr:MAG: hypothetical protein EWM72_00450 [Nitrospira sp.]
MTRADPILSPVLAGAETFGERAPESIEPRVTHFEYAADVRGLGSVEKQRRLRRIGIALAGSFQHAQRNQRIEEIPRAAGMKLEPLGQRGRVERPFGQLREQAEFNGAQQGLRTQKPNAELHDLRRS